MQYLVSVIDDKTGSATSDEMAAITAFNDDQLKAGGHWVFAGGLASPNTATVIDNRDGEAIFTDGPFLESKEYLAGIWIIEAPRPRRGTQARCRGVEALQSEGRGAAVPVNRVDVRQAITQAHHEEWARGTSGYLTTLIAPRGRAILASDLWITGRTLTPVPNQEKPPSTNRCGWRGPLAYNVLCCTQRRREQRRLHRVSCQVVGAAAPGTMIRFSGRFRDRSPSP